MNYLPLELLYTIFLNLNINELKTLYKTSHSIQTLLNTRNMLNLLNRQYAVNATSFNHFLDLYKKKAFSLLNKLGKIYHTEYGFDWDNEYYDDYTNTVKAFEDNISVFTEEGNLITSIDEINPDVSYGTLPNEFPEQLEKLSQMIMPYEIINLIQEVQWRHHKPELPINIFPNYIKMNIPFENITIKGQDLTIKDVLMASEALNIGSYTTAIENEYIILEDNEVLVLKIDVIYYY